jgi:DNA-binding response OmpR family regulator
LDILSFLRKQKRIESLPFNKTSSELKRKTKIVVIDDEEESFPYKLLQDDGYTIEWWEKVDAQKLNRLENGDFDIIILDIMGVADRELSNTDGIGVLKRIKNVNKHQIIVAFSGQSYDLSKTEFWRLADDALSKPVTFIQCKEILDSLIRKHINIISYWNAVKAQLVANNTPESNIRKIEKDIVKLLECNTQFDEKQFVNKFFSGVQNTASILTLIQAIFRIWS